MPLEAGIDETADQHEVKRVALRALGNVVKQENLDPLAHRPLESYLQQLSDAVLSSDPAALTLTVKAMRLATISAPVIAEIYVPAVARRLGDGWLADTVDFGTVTIACARLRRLLLSLEKEWGEETLSSSGSLLLVGVPEGDNHTLGASVLAGQLRHRGMNVRLDVELTVERLREYVLNQQLSGVLLSVGSQDGLAPAKELINMVRTTGRSTPVVIGGSILTVSRDIIEQTGADLIAQSVHEVLDFIARGEGSGSSFVGGQR